MRAKFKINTVTQDIGNAGNVERVHITAAPVCGDKPFGPQGESEDNTFARWSPSGELKLTITNPDLFGTLAPGQTYYLDFTKADS
jgi:hypothetical protein